MQPLEDLTLADSPRLRSTGLGFLRRRRAGENRRRHFGRLVRALRRDGTEVDQFRQLLFQQEDSSKMLSVVITESGRPVQHNPHALKLPGGQPTVANGALRTWLDLQTGSTRSRLTPSSH